MPTTGDGWFSLASRQDERPLWKIHWDAVLTAAKEELKRATDKDKTTEWPDGQDFIDIRVTTPKSGGVYRLFRTYRDGRVELGRIKPGGQIEIIQPQQIELTPTHITGFRSELSKQLNAMRG